MKKLALILTAFMLFCAVFSACGTAAEPEETTAETTAAESTTGVTTEETTVETTTEGAGIQTDTDTSDAEVTGEAVSFDEDTLAEAKYAFIYIRYYGGIEGLECGDIAEYPASYYLISDDEITGELVKYLTEPELTERENSWYRTAPTVSIEFSNDCVFHFFYEMYGDDIYLAESCYTYVGESRYVYDLSEEGIAYLEGLLDRLTIKYAEN